jgi:hypothetical protein
MKITCFFRPAAALELGMLHMSTPCPAAEAELDLLAAF